MTERGMATTPRHGQRACVNRAGTTPRTISMTASTAAIDVDAHFTIVPVPRRARSAPSLSECRRRAIQPTVVGCDRTQRWTILPSAAAIRTASATSIGPSPLSRAKPIHSARESVVRTRSFVSPSVSCVLSIDRCRGSRASRTFDTAALSSLTTCLSCASARLFVSAIVAATSDAIEFSAASSRD